MLSLLKNKIRNKFLQTDYIHPYIIWCIDVFLSVISSFSIFLFFHYLINISIHFNQQRYILLIAVISSIVWTGICKTYEGIIRYSTLVELTRIIYAMLLKALTFVLFAYITLDYIGLFIYSIIITDFISSVFLLMCTRILTVNFYYHLLPKGESVWLIIYEVKTILIMFSDLSPENPKTRNTGLWDIRYI